MPRIIWCREPWQYFAVLTPLRSVGVMGDGRTYANLVGGPRDYQRKTG